MLIGSDHRGFLLKEELKIWLEETGYKVEDVGASSYQPDDDYVGFAEKLGVRIKGISDKSARGILICGSGHGVDMVANKFAGIRAALCWNEEVARQAREHENANVLVLPSDWIDAEKAKKIAKVFLETEFSREERHVRRLEKIERLERDSFKRP